MAKHWKNYGVIELKKHNKSALRRHGSVRTPTLSVNVFAPRYFLSPAVIKMVINRPSLKPHTIIFKGQETKARKGDALSKCIPVILIVTHVHSRANPVSREIPSTVWLKSIFL